MSYKDNVDLRVELPRELSDYLDREVERRGCYSRRAALCSLLAEGMRREQERSRKSRAGRRRGSAFGARKKPDAP